MPYLEAPEKIQNQKAALLNEAKANQLRAAIVEKEQRQINRYFGGIERVQSSHPSFPNELLRKC